jgi:DNA-binding PadR family transcriptional regulator
MTGAYAHEWPGQGPWGQQWSRGRGFGAERGRPGDERERLHDERCGGHRGGRGRHGGGQSDLEALASWVLSRAGRAGPRGHRRPTPEELDELIALRRMRGFGGPGFGGPRGRGRGRGRARRGDVRLAVLRLLAEEPRNGYQLMQEIEERSGGHWRPSPGSMYPTLSQLEDEGLIQTIQAEGRRAFEITDAGREQVEARAGEPDPWTPADDHSEHAMAELGPLVIGIGKAVWQVASVGTDEQRERALRLLHETRRGLYGILAEDPDDADGTEPDDAGDTDPTGAADSEPAGTDDDETPQDDNGHDEG